MRIIRYLTPVVLVALAAGCSSLSVEVYQYRGALAHSYRTRLAEARGKANQAYIIFETDLDLKKYVDAIAAIPASKGVSPRHPRSYMERINGIYDEAEKVRKKGEFYQGGIPRPIDGVPGETSGERKERKLKNQRVRGVLSVLQKELREFGVFLSRLSVTHVLTLVGGKDNVYELRDKVRDLKAIGEDILLDMEFPDFADLLKHEKDWELINPVYAVSALGKSEYVIYKDETGNYQLKSVVFDPSDVARVARKVATKLISTIAGAYGIPVSAFTGQKAATTPLSVDLIEAETKRYSAQLAAMKAQNEGLRTQLQGVLGVVQGFGALDNTKREAAIRLLLRELDAYEKKMASIESEN